MVDSIFLSAMIDFDDNVIERSSSVAQPCFAAKIFLQPVFRVNNIKHTRKMRRKAFENKPVFQARYMTTSYEVVFLNRVGIIRYKRVLFRGGQLENIEKSQNIYLYLDWL